MMLTATKGFFYPWRSSSVIQQTLFLLKSSCASYRGGALKDDAMLMLFDGDVR